MILVDTAEPDDIIRLLQQAVDISVMPLNQSSRADYYFGGDDDKTIQFNRVQAGELLSNIDSMEDELRRYYNSADKNNMIIEGVITDIPLTRKDKNLDTISVRFGARLTTLFSYRIASNGYLFGEQAHDVSAEKFFAWLYRLKESGVATFFTHNFVGTAKLLVAIYHNCQKSPDTHTTLNRYYIPRVILGEGGWAQEKRVTIREQSTFIRGLMALSSVYNLDIGEVKATALRDAGYKTLYDLAFATVEELTRVKGIGKVTAEKLLTAIGVEL